MLSHGVTLILVEGLGFQAKPQIGIFGMKAHYLEKHGVDIMRDVRVGKATLPHMLRYRVSNSKNDLFLPDQEAGLGGIVYLATLLLMVIDHALIESIPDVDRTQSQIQPRLNLDVGGGTEDRGDQDPASQPCSGESSLRASSPQPTRQDPQGDAVEGDHQYQPMEQPDRRADTL